MYPISNALKAKFASNAKQYARITVGNTAIYNSRIRLGSFSANRYALAEDTVVFGSCVAAEFNVTLENGDGAYSTGTFLGNEAYVEVGCDLSGTVTYVPLGYFTFDMVTAQASALKLSALDRMMKFEKVVNPTPYSVSGTVSDLIDTVCTACGVPRGTFTLPVNGTLALSGELTDVKTYRDILRWIGEVTGTIAYIGYDGKLYFGWYSGTEDFSVDPSNRAQGSISDDATTITSVSIVQGENMVTAGTGAKIVIRDNALIPLASATAQTIADNLYNHVNGFTYRTFEAGVFPMPHIAPLDCGVYSDLDGNDFDVCCTDWTFTLNANTKIAGKGGKQAYGRGYTLDESVFTARNIAAGAVTAEKISVQDLAALRATIAGWNIGTEALYKEVTSGGYTYRVELCAPASITPNTQCITVKRKATGSSTWEIIDTTTYGGQHTAKDFIANGRVQIAPDYDLQEAGVYAVDLINNTTGYRTVLNPDFANIATNPTTGSGVHIDDAHVRLANDDTSASASSARVEFENYGVGYTGVRVAEGAVGTSGYKETWLGEELSISDGMNSALVRSGHAEVVSSTGSGQNYTEDMWKVDGQYLIGTKKVYQNGELSEYYRVWQSPGGVNIEEGGVDKSRINALGVRVYDANGNTSSELTKNALLVDKKDILRTHQSLVGGYGTQIPQNSDLNDYIQVGRYFCPYDSWAASLSNSPTANGFMMDVLSPLSATIDNESTGTYVYRYRRIIRFDGVEYRQRVNSSGTAGVFSFEGWRRVIEDTPTSLDNSVGWLKSYGSRPSSLDTPHSYNNDQRARVRLDLSTSSLSGGVNSLFGEGYVLTFMWDTTSRWDTQFFIPDADGKTLAYRTYRPNVGWGDVQRLNGKVSGTTTVGGIVWTWEKYDDGYVDMYADITLNGTWIAWGNQYILRNSTTTYQLPFTLSKKLVDVTSVVGQDTSSNACYPVNYSMIASSGVSESYTTCDICRPSAGTNNANYYCRKYIRGKI